MRRITALAAVTLAAALGAPAHAQQPCCTPGPGSVTITITGEYTGVLVNGLQVIGSCEAVAVGAVSAIVIDECYLTSNPETNYASTAPGNATASAVSERVTTLDFTLCYHAYAIPMTDPLNPAEAGGCADGLPVASGVGGLGLASGSN